MDIKCHRTNLAPSWNEDIDSESIIRLGEGASAASVPNSIMLVYSVTIACLPDDLHMGLQHCAIQHRNKGSREGAHPASSI